MRASDCLQVNKAFVSDNVECLDDQRLDPGQRQMDCVHLHCEDVASCAMGHGSLGLGGDHAISFGY
jgi:arginase family enzyme